MEASLCPSNQLRRIDLIGQRSCELESSIGANIFEIAQVILDSRLVANTTKGPQCYAKSIRAAEAAELPAAFDVRFHVREHARHPTRFHSAFQLRDKACKILHDSKMP